MSALILSDYDKEYGDAIKGLFSTIENHVHVLDHHNLVLFTGGEDVHPAMYGEKMVEQWGCNIKRDIEEARSYEKAKSLGIPCLGICRGAQFLNVMNGGKLYQHVSNHTRNHLAKCNTINGVMNKYTVVSTHHQMMYPADHRILYAWSEGISDEFVGLNKDLPKTSDGLFVEPEIVFYPDTRDLCVQFHSERDYSIGGAKEYVKTLVQELLIN